jgi:hypothetical protein
VQNRCLVRASWDRDMYTLRQKENIVYQAFALLGIEEMTDFWGRWWFAGAMLTMPRRRTTAAVEPERTVTAPLQ